MRNRIRLALIALQMIAINNEAVGAAQPGHCFTSSQFDGWRAGGKTLVYIRTIQNHYYEIDLSRECSTLTRPYAQLIITPTDGSLICSAIDLTLRASGLNDVVEPCSIKTMRELSPPEMEALPKNFRP